MVAHIPILQVYVSMVISRTTVGDHEGFFIEIY